MTSNYEVRGNNATSVESLARIDLKLEATVIPVSDVDRAKEFYGNLGWRLDADFPFDNGFRVVQFTPPGSACSVQFGTKITSATPGSAQGLYLIVSNIEDARDRLIAHGAKVSDIPRRNARRSISALRHERSSRRACPESHKLQLIRDVQRPGRQWVAVAGGHHPITRPHRSGRDGVHLGG
jgi:catechol 2,3-dioxygenase-like lactoylglutathione lyase family enzyme